MCILHKLFYIFGRYFSTKCENDKKHIKAHKSTPRKACGRYARANSARFSGGVLSI